MRPAEALLGSGQIEILGRMPWSSNATFLVEVRDGADVVAAVHKPGRGERPLWDFPGGLFRRERAAWVVSELLGWDLVPPTVLREDGPFGPGSLQLFVEADPDDHYFTVLDRPVLAPALRRLCAFDVITNAADRKSGHVLVDPADHVWGIDNGLTFHVEDKLRTVIWDFAGEALAEEVCDALCHLRRDRHDRELGAELEGLLSPSEVEVLDARIDALLRAGVFPIDRTGRRVPWPLV